MPSKVPFLTPARSRAKDEMGLVQNAKRPRRSPNRCKVPTASTLSRLTGSGAPWWDPYALGTISGLTRGGRVEPHIIASALESIAFQAADVIDAMKKDSGCNVERLAVDGGGSHNAFTMQWQANMLGCPVVRSATSEATALGAATWRGSMRGFGRIPRSWGEAGGWGQASSRLWRRRNVCGA